MLQIRWKQFNRPTSFSSPVEPRGASILIKYCMNSAWLTDGYDLDAGQCPHLSTGVRMNNVFDRWHHRLNTVACHGRLPVYQLLQLLFRRRAQFVQMQARLKVRCAVSDKSRIKSELSLPFRTRSSAIAEGPRARRCMLVSVCHLSRDMAVRKVSVS